jgi:acyl-homoserine lactone acylase PvdQ
MNLWAYKQAKIRLDPLPGIPKTDRGTYALAVELSKPLFRSMSVLPPGQSEDRLSPHYSDQRELAGYWRFKELLYKRDQLEKAFRAEKPGN